MALIHLIKKEIKKQNDIFKRDTLHGLNNNSRHILTSGRSAIALTDEKLLSGDNVLTIKDSNGKFYILAGRK